MWLTTEWTQLAKTGSCLWYILWWVISQCVKLVFDPHELHDKQLCIQYCSSNQTAVVCQSIHIMWNKQHWILHANMIIDTSKPQFYINTSLHGIGLHPRSQRCDKAVFIDLWSSVVKWNKGERMFANCSDWLCEEQQKRFWFSHWSFKQFFWYCRFAWRCLWEVLS